ncbi:cytochrome c [Thiomonas sp.]|uniref:c-type cytochrome n=1 Tax=Thiomonas sp. TaxID=2047785 RepID=UPI00262169B5|nr:cytochrome c [Thiomonas sp.]
MIRPLCSMRLTVHGGAFAALLTLGSAALAAAPGAEPAEFHGVNVARGQQFYTELQCASCHAQRMMGQAAAMYTRSDRKVHNARQLLAFTQMCVTQLNHELFPDEVRDIAAYLNQTYYHFK